jgi:acetoin utilization deacetylase AcuC-like enzyme
MSLALITHPACLSHDPGQWHPECPDRLRAVLAALSTEEFAGLDRVEAPRAQIEQLRRVHDAAYIDAVLRVRPAEGAHVALDADTVMSAGSAEAALRAAGGAVAAVDMVLGGEAAMAFVAVRPPGHHAEHATAYGFCLFNNVAVAAHQARARWGLRRVAVVDFDVHHGNGTQAMFFNDPELFYASSHQSPLFPGTGAAEERGVADNIVNVPLRAGTDGAGFRAAWSRSILPALDGFAPELLIISAGFDAHRADPLGQLRLADGDFAWITEELRRIAQARCGGRIVSVLEGGYDLEALASASAAHVRGLLLGV